MQIMQDAYHVGANSDCFQEEPFRVWRAALKMIIPSMHRKTQTKSANADYYNHLDEVHHRPVYTPAGDYYWIFLHRHQSHYHSLKHQPFGSVVVSSLQRK
eukprot:scaffold1993_cov147-Skeletonema_dohrnii-CCMP3373.AAC.3